MRTCTGSDGVGNVLSGGRIVKCAGKVIVAGCMATIMTDRPLGTAHGVQLAHAIHIAGESTCRPAIS